MTSLEILPLLLKGISALVLSNPPDFNFEMTDNEGNLNYFCIKWYDCIEV